MMRLVLAVLNLLGYPGIGTYLAGHKRSGLLQILLHTAATILSVGGVAVIAKRAWQHGRGIEEWSVWLANNYPAVILPLTVAVLGIIIFLANWLWSATTTKPAAKVPPPLP